MWEIVNSEGERQTRLPLPAGSTQSSEIHQPTKSGVTRRMIRTPSHLGVSIHSLSNFNRTTQRFELFMRPFRLSVLYIVILVLYVRSATSMNILSVTICGIPVNKGSDNLDRCSCTSKVDTNTHMQLKKKRWFTLFDGMIHDQDQNFKRFRVDRTRRATTYNRQSRLYTSNKGLWGTCPSYRIAFRREIYREMCLLIWNELYRD